MFNLLKFLPKHHIGNQSNSEENDRDIKQQAIPIISYPSYFSVISSESQTLDNFVADRYLCYFMDVSVDGCECECTL